MPEGGVRVSFELDGALVGEESRDSGIAARVVLVAVCGVVVLVLVGFFSFGNKVVGFVAFDGTGSSLRAADELVRVASREAASRASGGSGAVAEPVAELFGGGGRRGPVDGASSFEAGSGVFGERRGVGLSREFLCDARSGGEFRDVIVS